MKINVLLSINSIIALIYCVGLLLVPTFWIGLYGANPDMQATLLLRLVGALFGGIAVMCWFGRNAEPSKSREAMVLGLTVLNGFAGIVSVFAVFSGVYNQFAWGPVIVFGLLTFGFLSSGRNSMSIGAIK